MENDHSVNLVALEELKEIMGDDFSVLVDTFINDSEIRLKSINTAIVAQNGVDLREAAHSFKGSALNLAAEKLTHICKQLEDMGKAGNFDQIDQVYSALTMEFEQVKLTLTRSI